MYVVCTCRIGSRKELTNHPKFSTYISSISPTPCDHSRVVKITNDAVLSIGGVFKCIISTISAKEQTILPIF